jgi:hypothetical protein
MNIGKEPQDIRDHILKKELGSEKAQIIDYYGLICNEKLYWQKENDSYPPHEYFTHKFAKGSSLLGLVFRLNGLCYAKVKYFEKNWYKYQPLYYTWRNNNFVECELYEMEFIKHKDLNIIFDFRDLKKITRIEDFVTLCEYIEEQEHILEAFNEKYQKEL